MEEKITEQELHEYAQSLSKTGRYSHIIIVPEVNIIELYVGINSYTLFYGKSATAHLNPTISETQLKMLKENPELFMSLNRRYFFDNENSSVFSDDKTKTLLEAASMGLEKMPKCSEKVEIQKNIMAKVNGIKEEIKEFNKNM